MVIRTDLCDFTHYRVYPGKGQKFVSRDGKVHFLISSKVASLFLQKKKNAKLEWTQEWRKQNKKGRVEERARRRAKRNVRIQRAIVGLSLDELKEKRTAAKAVVDSPKAAKTAKIAGAAKPVARTPAPVIPKKQNIHAAAPRIATKRG